MNINQEFITVNEIRQVLGIGRSKAYELIKRMNKELEAQGYITIPGKVPLGYFRKRLYCSASDNEQ